MDFRMDKSSWVMIVLMLAIVMGFMIITGHTNSLAYYLQTFGIAILAVLVLIAVMCIPVLIYCYFAKVIPDIDYSIRAAFAFTILGLITEFIF